MANRENLAAGDSVDWVRGDELIAATVFFKGPKLIGIKIEREGNFFIRYVPAEDLRLRHGGKKWLASMILNSASNAVE